MYTVFQFSDLTLPTYQTNYTLSPTPAVASLVPTADRPFDNDGGGGRNQPAFPFTVVYRALVAESTLTAQRATLDALRDLVGTRAPLYRRANDDGATHACLAVLTGAPQLRAYATRGYLELTLNFAQLGQWRGADASWRLDTGILLDAGRNFDEAALSTLSGTTTALSLDNGNLPVTDALVILTAGSGPLTSFELVGSDNAWRWLGSLGPGESLMVDCGAFYASVSGERFNPLALLTGAHKAERLLEIPAGTTVFSALRSGGGTDSKLGIYYKAGWA